MVKRRALAPLLLAPVLALCALSPAPAATLVAASQESVVSPVADDPSLAADPAKIVDAAPAGPTVIGVTVDTSTGPKVVSKTFTSDKAAEAYVADKQDNRNTMAVSAAQPVTLDATSDDTYRSKQYALTTLAAESLWANSKGEGVVVAVIDTGVQGSHPDLAGRVDAGTNILTGGDGTSDEHGHGTHVAGIIAANMGNKMGVAGLAPKVSILPVRIANADGASTSNRLASGIYWAIDHGANILNMSYGGTGVDANLRAAVAYAEASNVVFVASAGNDKKTGNRVSYPAAYPHAVAVGATDAKNAIGTYSNTGDYVDVVAPGTQILSTYMGSQYGYKSGTSMAAPYVCAAIAAVAAKLTGPDRFLRARDYVLFTGKNLGATGWDSTYGNGLIQPVGALAKAIADTKYTSVLTLTAPSTTISPAESVAVTGRLTTSTGVALEGRAVTITSTNSDGEVTPVGTAITNDRGYYTSSEAVYEKVTYTASYEGSATTTAQVATLAITNVNTPAFSVAKSATNVTVTVPATWRGFTISLQKKDGDVFTTVADHAVPADANYHVWDAPTTDGIYRLVTLATSRYLGMVSAPWAYVDGVDAAIPAAVKKISGSAKTTAITLSWTKATNATAYNYSYRVVSLNGAPPAAWSAEGSTTSLKTVFSGLKKNTKYEFMVVATNKKVIRSAPATLRVATKK